MRTGTHLAAGALLLAAITFGTFACAQQQAQTAPQSNASGHAKNASMDMHKAMMQGQSMAMPMSGDVDKDFATMMTMHHQQAVKMADVLIKHGRSTELKALARRMKAAQQAEIKQMAPHTK